MTNVCPQCGSNDRAKRNIFERERTGGPGRMNCEIRRESCPDAWHADRPAPSAPQSTQTAREFLSKWKEGVEGGPMHRAYSSIVGSGTTKYCLEFAESYASSRVASLQQELDRQKELAQVWTNLSTEWEGLIKKEKAKLSTLTGIARELAADLRSAIDSLDFEYGECEGCKVDPCMRCQSKKALQKFTEWGDQSAATKCGKNMGNDLLVIPCDLPEGHHGPCERNVWPVSGQEQTDGR